MRGEMSIRMRRLKCINTKKAHLFFQRRSLLPVLSVPWINVCDGLTIMDYFPLLNFYFQNSECSFSLVDIDLMPIALGFYT